MLKENGDNDVVILQRPRSKERMPGPSHENCEGIGRYIFDVVAIMHII